MRRILLGVVAVAMALGLAGTALAQDLSPPRGPISARWLGGSLIYYPGDIAGNIYFVDSNSGASTNSGLTWDYPLATIDQAVNKCTANHDDWIIVHPAHEENLAADSAIDIDQEGITVWGIRHGSQMPTLRVTAAAGDCKLAAANTTVANIRVRGCVDAGTGAIEVSAADCAVLNCVYEDSTGQATDVIITTAAADRLLIDGLRFIGAAADGGDTAICLVGADDAIIRNFYIYGNFDLGAIQCRTTLSARIHVHSGYIWTAGGEDLAIKDLITSSTGFIGPDLHIMLKDNAANITEAVTGATFHMIDPVYVCNLAGEKGMLIDWTASVDE